MDLFQHQIRSGKQPEEARADRGVDALPDHHRLERRDANCARRAGCAKNRKKQFSRCLTPELSRTDLRRGGVVHVTAQAEPRSGLGLNELLGRRLTAIFCDLTQFTKAKSSHGQECDHCNSREFGRTDVQHSFIWRNVCCPHMKDDEVAAPKRCNHRCDENKPQSNSLGH